MNKKIVVSLVVLIIVGFGIYYLVSKNSLKVPYAEAPTTAVSPVNTNNPVAPAPAPAPAPVSVPVQSENKTVSIKNFSFNSSALTVKTGTKVTWTNNDSTSHTITSDSGNLLDSPILAPGESFSLIFTNSGSTSYHCKIHPSMKGTVIVQN